MAHGQLKFGLSLPLGSGGVAALPALPDAFEVLELPGGALDETAALKEFLRREDFACCDFRDLIAARLSREITGESRAIVTEYKEQLRRMLKEAASFGAQCAGIDPDWERLSADPAATAVWNDILRATAGDRMASGIRLRIPVRIPGTAGVAVRKAAEWLLRLAGSQLSLALDVNPHELLHQKIDWDEALTPFRFEADVVRLCYESELGNQLLYVHVQTLLAALRRWRREVTIYFAPSGRADLEALAEVVRAAEKESL